MPLINTLHFLSFEGGSHLHPSPVILIHGIGQDASIWPPALRRLVGFRVMALDLPGHGRSPGPGLHAVEAYAQQVITFMASLNIPRAFLVGTSLGGAVALYIALEYPNLVQALGLISCPPWMALPATWFEALENPLTRANAVQRLEQHLLIPKTPQAITDSARKIFARQRLEVRYADWKALSRFDVRDRLSALQVPALWICGAKDPLLSASSLRLLRYLAITGLKLTVLPDVGHWVMLEKPAEIGVQLRNFLAQAQAQKTPGPKTSCLEDANTSNLRNEIV